MLRNPHIARNVFRSLEYVLSTHRGQYPTPGLKEQRIENIDNFTAMALADLSTLHAGAIIGLGVTETEQEIWLSGKP